MSIPDAPTCPSTSVDDGVRPTSYGVCHGFHVTPPDDEKTSIRRWHELFDQLAAMSPYVAHGHEDAA